MNPLDGGVRSYLRYFDVVVLAYLAGWFIFAIGAAWLQWWLHTPGALHGHLLVTSAVLTGANFIGAGVYQLTSFKDACLSRCRSPAWIFCQPLEERPLGCAADGFQARTLLHRVLLGVNAADVRQWHDECHNHGHAQRFYSRRPSVTCRTLGVKDSRVRVVRMGALGAGPGITPGYSKRLR